MNIDFNDIKIRIIFVILVLVIMPFFINTEEVLECKSKLKHCTLSRTNVYNITSSKNVMIAGNISGKEIEKYYKERRTRRHHAGWETRYRLYLVSKTGAKKEIFSDYRTEKEAETKGDEILNYIKNETYLFKVAR